MSGTPSPVLLAIVQRRRLIAQQRHVSEIRAAPPRKLDTRKNRVF